MEHIDERRIPLRAISARQRRLVEEHLPLVFLTLRRCRELTRSSWTGRDHGELIQEGCLALVEAVRTHDPTRYGDFATYAMARIRYAMSHFVHEHESLIRIPYITQRRRKQNRAADPKDRHRPDSLPRVVRLRDDRRDPSRFVASQPSAENTAHHPGAVSIGDLIRECYDRAVSRVVQEMRSSPRSTPRSIELVDRCARERWSIPEPEAKTPIRQLARALACSTGRITRCEERFKTKVAAALEADAAFHALRRMVRQYDAGWRHRLSEREIEALRRSHADRADPTSERRPQGVLLETAPVIGKPSPPRPA